MTAADRDLLFGLLALQNGLIDQGQLVAAFPAWTRDKARPLADHLVARGDLDAERPAGVEAMVGLHLKKHGGDVEKSLAADPCRTLHSRKPGAARRARTSTTPCATSGPARSGAATRTPTAPPAYSVGSATSDGQRFRILRPHARGGLGAVFVALDSELHREVALKQILDKHADDPRQPPAVPRSRPRSPAGSSTPGIVPVYGLGTYADGRPYYAMRFIRGDSLKEAIDRFHQAHESDGGRWGGASPAGSRDLELRKLLRRFTRRLQRHRLRPLAAACSTATSSRPTSSWASTARRWWSTGGWPSRWAAPSPVESGERTLMPVLGQRVVRDAARQRAGHAGLHEPRAGRGRARPAGPAVGRLQPGRDALLPADRQAAVRRATSADVIRAVQRGEFRPPRQLDPRIDPALEAVCLKAMAHRARGPLRVLPGAGRRPGALDGRRAGIGLARAAVSPGAAMGAAEPHGGDGRGRGAGGRGGRAVGRAGRADPGQGRLARSLARETRANTALAAPTPS